MENLTLYQKRFVSYVIQTVIFIATFFILQPIIASLTMSILENFFPNLTGMTSNLSGLHLDVTTIQNVFNSNIQTAKEVAIKYYRNLLIAVSIYSVVLYVVLPIIIRTIFSITGDIGKKIVGLHVVRNGELATNSLSIKTSPAFKTFRIYLTVIVFFAIIRPFVATISGIPLLPKEIVWIIKIAYLVNILMVIVPILTLISYLINFLRKRDVWRKKANIEIIDDLETYIASYEKPKPQSIIRREKEGERREVMFPIFYQFMLQNNFSKGNYYILEKKAADNPRLAKNIKYIEFNQRRNPHYMVNNYRQVNEILACIEE